MSGFKEIIRDKATINFGLAIINMIVWTRLLKGGFIVSSVIVILLFYYANILTTGKLSVEPLKNILFYLWLINVVFYFSGALLGSLGIIIASLVLLGRITYRAVSSDFYKSSVNNMVKTLKGEDKKWKTKSLQKY